MSANNDLITTALRLVPVGVILWFLGKILYDRWNLKAVLRVMKEELKKIQKRLDEDGKKDIPQGHSPISKDSLKIYRSNRKLIGRIDNSALRDRIIEVYTSLDTLIKEYEKNTQYLKELKETDTRLTGRFLLFRSCYEDQAAKIKNLLNDLKGSMEALCKMLEKELSPHEKWNFRSGQSML